jgi:hypothetical protein
MKQFMLPSLMACFLFAFQNANAQVDLTLNPVGLLFGDFNLGADFGLSKNFSIEAQAGLGSNKIGSVKGSNLGINALGKFYFSPKHGADRFYADVFTRFVNRKWKYDDGSGFSNYTTTRVGIGFGLGYKVVSKGGFVFDIGFGGGRALSDKNKYEDSTGAQEQIDWPKLMLQGKLAIGYRF